jgi:hypothetical protein
MLARGKKVSSPGFHVSRVAVPRSTLIHEFQEVLSEYSRTLLRRKPRSLRPWMNAERVPFEALKERSRVCFGGFRPSEACGEAMGFSP